MAELRTACAVCPAQTRRGAACCTEMDEAVRSAAALFTRCRPSASFYGGRSRAQPTGVDHDEAESGMTRLNRTTGRH